MQRILVIGAHGFVGRSLMMALRKGSWAQPIAGVRRRSSAEQAGVEYRLFDATDEAAVARALVGVDSVVNCVAGSPESISEAARTLFAGVRAPYSGPRVVHLSTMSVYGDASGLIDETAPLRPNLGPYSAAKVIAEHHAATYPNAVILRPGCVYGPHSPQWSTRVGHWLMARRLGDLGPDGDGYCNLVHIDDVITAIVQCLKSEPPASNVFNLSTPDPPTWNEFLVRYGCALRAVPVRRVSHRRLLLEAKLQAPGLKLIELAARRCGLAALRLPPPIPPSVLRLMRQEIRLDVRRATQELGIAWKSVEAGIHDTAQWYLREYRGMDREQMASVQ